MDSEYCKKRIYKCSIVDCKSKSSDDGVILHRLPNIADIRVQWIQCINITNKIGPNTFVCNKHFKSEDYLPTNKGRLKKIAVPSVMLSCPKSKSKSKFIPNLLRKNKELRSNSTSKNSPGRPVSIEKTIELMTDVLHSRKT